MSTGKSSGKPARQLLLSEAISQQRNMASSQAPTGSGPNEPSASIHTDITIERILQKITAVGYCLEVVNSKITNLATESKSIRTDIPGQSDRD
ncbi:hypothetical protein NDU88_009423 [Pleurodeles waltl]|uniref:Uncharacterized protein n=1 Tax=Pleurodeles waltl TaxID=8319 RepID=A0AAV7PVT3_PLEWA|nr:hypothetical protein NDU88_009423 [Pleurodeles waltl]